MMRMKRILLLLLAGMAFAALSAREKVKVDFFARLQCDRNVVYMGDSCLVSVVLYADAPFEKVDCHTKPDVKNARLRERRLYGGRPMGRTQINGKVYYTYVWTQYVLTPEKLGNVSMPVFEFTGTFRIYLESRDPFSLFFGAPQRYRLVETDGESGKLKIEVKEKPLRTTEEIMRSGGGVL